MAKDTRKAGCSTAASGASCDEDDGEEEHGDDGEEDWPENGHDDSASGDEFPAGDIDEDESWNRPVGEDDEVEEWLVGDSDNVRGVDADREHGEAAAHATEQAPTAATAEDMNAETDAVADDEVEAEARTKAEAEAGADAVAAVDAAAYADADADAEAEADTDAAKGGADVVLFDGEDSEDDPWRIMVDDDVPLLKRRLRHRLQTKQKLARVVLSDNDSSGEERPPRLTAADKGKTKDCEAFWKFVRINKVRHNIDLTRIINADQTLLFVEMPAERTIEHRGALSVPICTTGYEKTRLTVMLVCTASGENLRPSVWFKLKNVPNFEIP
ncbi:unnamed protein product [Closterium sp. NIES-54]